MLGVEGDHGGEDRQIEGVEIGVIFGVELALDRLILFDIEGLGHLFDVYGEHEALVIGALVQRGFRRDVDIVVTGLRP